MWKIRITKCTLGALIGGVSVQKDDTSVYMAWLVLGSPCLTFPNVGDMIFFVRKVPAIIRMEDDEYAKPSLSFAQNIIGS